MTDNSTCSRCGKSRNLDEAFYRNLHEGHPLVCYKCHVELTEEERDD